VEAYWRGNQQIYVTPLGSGEVCVVLLSHQPGTCFEEALREFPGVADRLKGAELISPPRGAITTMYSLRRVYKENVALTGDASGGVDAITGEGLGLGFRQAIALASALKTGELDRYQAAHRGLARRPLLMSRGLLFLGRNPRLRGSVFGKLERDPVLFARLLSMHGEENSLSKTVAATARLGWQFLTV
jgi:flavin-dependent dehydrogenase